MKAYYALRFSWRFASEANEQIDTAFDFTAGDVRLFSSGFSGQPSDGRCEARCGPVYPVH